MPGPPGAGHVRIRAFIVLEPYNSGAFIDSLPACRTNRTHERPWFMNSNNAFACPECLFLDTNSLRLDPRITLVSYILR